MASEFSAYVADLGFKEPKSGQASVHGHLHRWRTAIEPRVAGGRRGQKPMELVVGYVEDSFNAFASNESGVDIIGVSEAVPMVLGAVFRGMVHNPDFFPEVGNASNARRGRANFPVDGDALKLAASVPVIQDDPARAELAVLLSIIAEYWICEHELAHVEHGHVDWFQRTFGLMRIDETGMTEIPGLNGIDLQTLEWDADLGALDRMLYYVLDADIVPVAGGMAQWALPAEGQFGSWEQAVKRLSVALYTCYRIFSEDDSLLDADEIIKDSHPPASIRIGLCLYTMTQALFHRCGIDEAASEAVIIQSVIEAERAYSYLFSQKPINIWGENEVRVGSELQERFEANWPKLREQLEPLKRGGALAP